MTITTVDGFFAAMANNSSRIIIDKASIANAAATQFHSLWRATGQPGQGAIPGATAVPTNATVGAISFTQQTAPATSYLGQIEIGNTNTSPLVEIHDRLAHMGGLSGTVTTAQNALVDIDALLATSNIDARKGAADYSDVLWWLEWYTDTGGTSVTATVNVTFNDGTSNNLSGITLAATRRASFMQPLNGFIQAADSGKYIRDVNTVQLSATTGAAGSFGVTATRFRGSTQILAPSLKAKENWADLGIPEIHNSSCLFMIVNTPSTLTGALRGTGKIAHG